MAYLVSSPASGQVLLNERLASECDISPCTLLLPDIFLVLREGWLEVMYPLVKFMFPVFAASPPCFSLCLVGFPASRPLFILASKTQSCRVCHACTLISSLISMIISPRPSLYIAQLSTFALLPAVELKTTCLQTCLSLHFLSIFFVRHTSLVSSLSGTLLFAWLTWHLLLSGIRVPW